MKKLKFFEFIKSESWIELYFIWWFVVIALIFKIDILEFVICITLVKVIWTLIKFGVKRWVK